MSADGRVSRRRFLWAAAAGAAATGASAGVSAQEDGGNESGGEGDGGENGGADENETEGGDGGGGGGGTETVELVDYAYEPGTEEPLYVTPGTEVNFVWVTDTHNIVVDSQPEGAGWEGYETVENAGFEYAHTFEVEGEYEFFCAPHQNLGMEATIVVNEEGAPPDEGGGGGPAVPDSAKSIGVATSVAMGAVLGLSYVFLKYGGGGGREPVE